MKKKSINKLIAGALVLGSILSVGRGAYAATEKGWELRGKDGKEYFYNNGVLQKNGIITVWGIQFKCDADGVVVGDIVSDSKDVDKYMHQSSEDYKNNDKRWKKVNGNWHFCYLDDDQKEYSEANITKDDWEEVNGYWYHFNKNGDMDKNTTIKDDSGNEYKLNADGVLINREKPVLKISEDTEKDGVTFTEKDGKTYSIDEQGNKRTGWVMKGGKWYFFNKQGVLQKNTSVIEKGQKYVLDVNGVWIR